MYKKKCIYLYTCAVKVTDQSDKFRLGAITWYNSLNSEYRNIHIYIIILLYLYTLIVWYIHKHCSHG